MRKRVRKLVLRRETIHQLALVWGGTSNLDSQDPCYDTYAPTADFCGTNAVACASQAPPGCGSYTCNMTC